jgi:glycosyltransferase involved in cell wall biosynthesis
LNSIENPLVSIIVPCYNQAQYLDECLESVLNQTYSNWECIIVNDDSPDNTDEIAEKWPKRDSRFQYFKKTNGGVSSARNYGIAHSSGEFILPLDSDDKICRDFIMLALPKFTDSSIKVVTCKVCFFGERDGIYNLPYYSLEKLALDNMIVNTAFYRKIDWIRTGGYDEHMEYGLEDWEFWINLLKNGGDVVQIDSVQFFYRIKKKSRNANFGKNNQNVKKTKDYITTKHAAFYFSFFGNPIDNYNTLNKRLVKFALKISKGLSFIKKILTR